MPAACHRTQFRTELTRSPKFSVRRGVTSPVVLEVRLEDFVTEIIFGLAARLAKAWNISREQIRKGVPRELEKLVS